MKNGPNLHTVAGAILDTEAKGGARRAECTRLLIEDCNHHSPESGCGGRGMDKMGFY